MTAFPSSYPGHADGPKTALSALLELSMRKHWGDPEFQSELRRNPELQSALIGRYDISSSDEPLKLTLPDAVDLALRAYWTPDSEMHSRLYSRLQSGDYRAAATLLRSGITAPDELRIAPLSAVASAIKAIVERLAVQ